MTDLDRRFLALDRLDAPDLWAIALERAATAEQPRMPWWRSRPLAVAAMAAIVTIAAGAVLWLTLRPTGPEPPVAPTVAPATTATTTTTMPTTTSTVPTDGLDPDAAARWADWEAAVLEEDSTLVEGDGHILKAVAASEDAVVAVGDATGDENSEVPLRNGIIWVSEDGLTWDRVVDPEDLEFGGRGLEAVVAGGPGFIAGGSACDSDVGECFFAPALFTSIDGRAWDRVTPDPEVFGDRGGVYDFLALDDGILAMGAACFGEECGGAAWWSDDGITWERIWGVEPDNWGGRLVEVDGGIVSLDGFTVWRSPDGATWTEVPHDPDVFAHPDPESGWAAEGVAVGTDRLIAVGTDGNNSIVWQSIDGVTWERIPEVPGAFEDGSMMAVIPWGDGFLAVGPQFSLAEIQGPTPGFPDETSGPQLWWSPDGLDWYRFDPDVEDEITAIYDLVEFRGMVVVVGQRGPWFEGHDAIWIISDPPPDTPGE